MARLRLLTANLLVDRADPESLRSVLEDTQPDVVAVQELGDRKARILADMYEHGHLSPKPDGFGLGVVASRPVTIDKVEMPVRAGWVATLDPADWDGLDAPLDVVNLHLVNPLERPWKRTQARRRSQIGATRDYLEGRAGPSVVLGDMNTSPIWPEYRLLTELGVDAATTAGTAKRTWAHFLGGPRWIRIDHAFVAGATPISTSIHRIDGTDHRALLVDIEV